MMIAEQIKNARQAKGITLKELSAKTGINLSNLSRIEAGLIDARESTLVVIAKALRTSFTINPLEDKK